MNKLFFLILIFLPFGVFSEGQKEPALTIIYSASLNGNLDGCDCKSEPKAGLVKRIKYLKELASRDKILLIDGGDSLDLYPDKEISRIIFTLYAQIGYDVVGVGDQDFVNGAKHFLDNRHNYPLLSNNLTICPTSESCVIFSGSPLFLVKNGIKVGIFSLLDPKVIRFTPEKLKKQLTKMLSHYL